jgi:hypothetical protein
MSERPKASLKAERLAGSALASLSISAKFTASWFRVMKI